MAPSGLLSVDRTEERAPRQFARAIDCAGAMRLGRKACERLRRARQNGSRSQWRGFWRRHMIAKKDATRDVRPLPPNSLGAAGESDSVSPRRRQGAP